jgi:hypothetical protein
LLAERRDAWEQRQESLRYYDQAMSLPALKAERPALAGGTGRGAFAGVAERRGAE